MNRSYRLTRRSLVPLALAAFSVQIRPVEAAQVPQGTWVELPPDTPAESHGLTGAGNSIYRLGSNSGTGASAEAKKYEIGGAWSAIANLPIGSRRFTAVTVGETIYAVGVPDGPNSRIFAFPTAEGVPHVWTTVGSLTPGRWGAAAAVWHGKIYICGGVPSSGQNLNGMRLVESFDPASGLFTRLDDLPDMRVMGCAGVIGDTLYFAGGTNTLLFGASQWNLYAMDLTETTPFWTADRAPMPESRFQAASFTLNDRFYIVAGSLWLSDGATPLPWVNTDTTFEYDPFSNTWAVRAPIPRGGRSYPAACSLAGRGYVYGGYSRLTTPQGATGYFYAYDPGVAANTASGLSQRISSGQPMQEGGEVPNHSMMMFRAHVTHPDATCQVELEVELTCDGQSRRARSGLFVQGDVDVYVPNLPPGAWTWRCRSVSDLGVEGTWVDFSDGLDGTPATPDFRVLPPPEPELPQGGGGGGGRGSPSCGVPGAGAGPILIGLLLLACTRLGRRPA